MKHSFELLGLDETATKEQVLEAYARKKTLYSGSAFEEDPKYVKRKLADLEQAVCEAYILAEPVNHGKTEEKQVEALRRMLSEDEMHMEELYHKHLTGRFNRAIGVTQKKRSAAQKKADSAYKGSVLLFWAGIMAAIILIGLLLQ